jgi:hypothetical protein
VIRQLIELAHEDMFAPHSPPASSPPTSLGPRCEPWAHRTSCPTPSGEMRWPRPTRQGYVHESTWHFP